MKTPNISRQSGGAGTKLKVNRMVKRTVALAVILVGGLIICNFLYLVLDQVMNGFVREWFDRNFIYHEWVPVAEGQDGYLGVTIRWSRLKDAVFKAFLVTVLILACIIRLISVVYAGYRERKLIRATGLMMRDFMRHDREASEVFPAEYAEVSLQMAEIKASIQRQEQLQKEEAGRKNDLITYLAHDLKTPLTSVIGYLSLLDEAPDMPDAQRAKYVHITLDKARRLEKLINEFFEITRYNLQQIVLEKETVDLHFMLIQMTDEFYPILNGHGNTVRLELEPCGEGDSETVTVYGDREKLARVFNNILKNAIAYSYPDTEICISCSAVNDRAYILFSNRGKTIPGQKLDAVFEKFFRLDDARTTNTGGAGLGLAIARDIVTLHGGTISAESRDEITTFTVELPLQL